MSEAATTPDTSSAPAETSEVEAALSPQEQAALQVAREGLPVVDPHAKPDNRPQRPEGVPEKFWDAAKGEVRVDALTQSYAELEAKLSGKQETPAEPAADAADVEVKNGKIVKKEEAAVEEAAANPLTETITAAATEFTSEGKFTEETATKLAELGIPPEVQSVYLAGLSALQEQQTAKVHGFVGGEENYNAMAQWAAQTLSDAELDAFNTALDNPALAENAVSGLFARYSKAAPSEGRKVAPVNGAATTGDIFNTREEMTQAMSDPRYGKDVIYQREVVEKLARTRAAGISFNR